MMCKCRIICPVFKSLTPDGSFAALTLKALVLGDGCKRGVGFLLSPLLPKRAWLAETDGAETAHAAAIAFGIVLPTLRPASCNFVSFCCLVYPIVALATGALWCG
jgi:hypothetical protein